ncbi:GntR family transcriptional regulator [Aquabacter sp. CN5-332]|uniref:GntR family transcriptional regulator n=1 Tax=Aquabacter sp. CN5-332 TaxID=3156608 RepID=UPI0032B32B4D
MARQQTKRNDLSGGAPASGSPEREASKTFGEEAYRLLRRDILSGRLAPGHKLQFRQLVQRYDLGIAPLREALSKLASERLVSFEGQRGFAVAPISREELHEVSNLWSELTAAGLRIAIAKGDADWEADVIASLHRLSRTPLPASPEDYEAIENWERLHAQFHTNLIACPGSSWREHFCSVLCDQFERYRRAILMQMATSAATARQVDKEHKQIAEAAVKRESDRAVQLLVDHFSGNLAYLDAQYDRLSLQAHGAGLQPKVRTASKTKSKVAETA